MRAGSLVAIAYAAGLMLAGAAAAEENWVRTVSPTSLFSVETPCNAAELAELTAVPDAALGAQFVPNTRVLCRKDHILFLAAEVAAPEASSARPLYDMIVAQVAGDETAEGAPKETMIDGRRAMTNRQEKDGVVAQSGFVEASPTRVVMFITGTEPNSGVSVEAQRKAIDRFYASATVVGK